MERRNLIEIDGKRLWSTVLRSSEIGPGKRGEPMLPPGEGVMNFPALLAAAGDAPEWLVVELDEYAGTMLDAVRRSYDYLTSTGLGRGRN